MWVVGTPASGRDSARIPVAQIIWHAESTTPLSAQRHQQHQGERTECHPAERDPQGAPVLVEHLDEQEARPPDRGEQHELRSPRGIGGWFHHLYKTPPERLREIP